MIDKNGFRLNVGIILTNKKGLVFLGKRKGHKNAWQFPQGGVDPYETLQETMYRELFEETGLTCEDVQILGSTKQWLYYRLPYNMRRHKQKPLCIGQKQKWFLLKLTGTENKISLTDSDSPEFTAWRWANYWEPLDDVISFKYRVYKKALQELEPILLKKIIKSS